VTPADVTARLIAVRSSAALNVRRGKVPRLRYPTLIESDYARILAGWVQEWRTSLQPLIAELPTMLATRFDDARKARRHIEKARSIVRGHAETTKTVANRTAKRTADHHKQEFKRQTKAALGVEVPTMDRNLHRNVELFAQENASLISSLGSKAIADIETMVNAAFTSGISADEIGEQIAKRLDIAEKHARFIARDQMGKLYARVARMRHVEVGVKQWKWTTMQDSRVRPSHRDRHGKTYAYVGEKRPPIMPGEEIGCRCWEEPVFDEIRELAGIPNRARATGNRPTAVRLGR
jgi:SPP1 gp7 family putative phage head morphogenesis protein